MRIIVTLALLFFMVACSTAVTQSTADVTTVVEVRMFKFKFVPEQVTVKPGTIVRWVNIEKRQYHSVWFEKMGLAESEYLFPGDTYEQKFDDKGAFPYRCGPHPQMTGLVIVE